MPGWSPGRQLSPVQVATSTALSRRSPTQDGAASLARLLQASAESPSDLERLQEELSEAGPQIAQLPAAQRQMAEEARELVQAKLHTAKQLFDDQSRGALTGQAFSAKLKSL